MTPTAALGALVAAPGAQPGLPGSPGGASSGTGQEFLALVRALLGQGEAPAPTGGATGPAKPSVETDKSDKTDDTAGTVETAGEPGATSGDQQAAPVDPSAVPAVPAVPVVPVVPAALAQAITAPVTVTPSTDAATAQPQPGAADAASNGDPVGAVGPVPQAPSRGVHPVPAEALPTPAAHAPGAPAPGAPAPDAPDAKAQPEVPVVPAPASGAPATAATVPSSLTPVTAAAPVTATSDATPAPAQVTQQVFPEVVRIAGRGDGPRRMTLRLQPEFLGEVRVVMTSHKGELQVSLAAGEAARHALTEGTPELRRLLESVGATDARIVIRDLPAGTLTNGSVRDAAPAAPSTVRTDVPTDLAGGPGSGTGRPGGDQTPDQKAHQRGSNTALEGTLDAANPSRRTDSVTRARTAGLDVTM